MKRKFIFLSFIEGAAVMAAELCGAKLLAPVFGSSLYVWASVMGITLVALAGGYFFGGWITERSSKHDKNLFRILIAASLFLVLMPVISYYLVPRISYMAFLPAVVTSTILLLFFPVFLLGASSPLFIVLQTSSVASAGKISGTVYAVSTFGGILATFICGFYLIPEAGLSFTLLFFGILLFVAVIISFKIFKAGPALLLAGVSYLSLQFTLSESKHLFNSESVLGKLTVEDLQINQKKVRVLKINDIIQTEMDLNSRESISDYIHLLDTLIGERKEQGRALVLGLGGGLTANLLVKKKYSVTGVEFDERIATAARDFFFLHPSVRVECKDARDFLNHCSDKYDLILFDLFKAEEQPSHVLTTEIMNQIRNKNISADGRIFVNWHGYTSGEIGKGTAVLKNTLDSAGYYTELFSLGNNESHRNIIFRCTNKNQKDSGTKFPELFVKLVSQDSKIVNTDDKPVLEKYNALANKAWRTNYLRYYQHNQNED